MKFDNTEIPALNFILERILTENFPLYANELVSSGFITSKDFNKIENEFECLLSVFTHYNLGTVTGARNEDHGASIVKNGNTARFRKEGGFTNLYQKLGIESTNYELIDKTQKELNEKINKIGEKLKKQGYGQEILFNELQELKELYPQLTKKNWGEILKGKLIDLGISEILNREAIEMVFKDLTNQILRIK